MNTPSQLHYSSIYRIDKFSVPNAARHQFLNQLNETKDFLDGQTGCRQNLVLEVQSGSDRFNFVIIVEWDGVDAFEKAKAAMAEERGGSGFNPHEFIAQLGIEADMANYGAVGTV